jgi:hypothetical protein
MEAQSRCSPAHAPEDIDTGCMNPIPSRRRHAHRPRLQFQFSSVSSVVQLFPGPTGSKERVRLAQ